MMNSQSLKNSQHKKGLGRKIALLMSSSALAAVFIFGSSYLHSASTGQGALKKEGLNPAIAEELAPGGKIRIKDAAESSKFSSLFNLPAKDFRIDYIRTNVRASPPLPNADPGSDYCTVNINIPDNFPPLQIISELTGLYPDDILNTPFSKRDIYGYMLMHEMRHCSKDNISLTSNMEQEGDADYSALSIIKREHKNTDTIKWVFNMRAALFPTEEEHDVFLYLDAKLNGKTMPSLDKIREANKAAGKYIAKHSDADDKVDTSSLSSLPPLAQKRVEAYIKAQEYFRTPSAQNAAAKPPGGPKVS